ncbi:MAG TPA: hydantoinase/oxoprolinase family protein [Bacillota bacterium]
MTIRVAVDIGGTFTDLVYLDEATGRVGLAKTSTTPGRLQEGVLAAVREAGFDPAAVTRFVHGTTAVINAITERKGVRVGLLTTRGMRDILEIARGNRPDIYNLRYRKPRPFVPRHLRLEVRERLAADGAVVEPLCEDDVAAAAAAFRQAGVEAVAVCFLHAYANPDHERRAGDLLARLLPDAFVTLSHEITREWREYERTNTAVLNAYVGPIADRYLGHLEAGLRAAGVAGTLQVMQSSGGTSTFAAARRTPIHLVESGPVGGVVGAAALARDLQLGDVLTLDIGGTTAKSSLIRSGEVTVTTEYRLEWTPRFAGYPVKVPVVDIVEIGAGGGSIAWIDDTGGLHVGPESAGADPGPAAYGRGGTRPTVTDANLIAGRLDPSAFLGGRMNLDPDAARRAYEPLAAHYGIAVDEAALGVLRVADAVMMNALKLVSVQRGYDPRDFTLVVMGGGGPLHGPWLARELGIGRVIVPVAPGHFSAYGMLVTDLRRDRIQTFVAPIDGVSPVELESRYAQMERELIDAFAVEGIDRAAVTCARAADLRYRGQEHTVRVAVPGSLDDDGDLDAVVGRFHEAHERQYTFRLDSPVEVVNLLVTAFARTPRPPRRRLEPAAVDRSGVDAGAHAASGSQDARALTGRRRVAFGDGAWFETPVYDRERLAAGAVVPGPAVVAEQASTTLLHPGMVLTVDDFGNLHIDTGVRR